MCVCVCTCVCVHAFVCVCGWVGEYIHTRNISFTCSHSTTPGTILAHKGFIREARDVFAQVSSLANTYYMIMPHPLGT